jgi:parallel beta-helix repeat protein
MIVNNSIYDNEDDGIELEGSDYNTIMNNLVFNNSDDGMDIEHSFNNTLINNTVCLNTDEGIKLKNSSNNNIRNNIIYTNDGAGIYLCRSWDAEPVDGGSTYNTITSNILYSNGGEGIKLKNNSSNNQIYNNNLIYNDEQAYDDSNNNSWDNGPIIGGNYWCDHECVGNPSNGSQPYYIGRDGIDLYPFEDPIGELPPLPPPVPRTNVGIFKTEWLFTSDTYIDHNQTYNFDIGWDMDFGTVQNLDNVTATLTTPIDITYIGTSTFYTGTWELYNCSVLPFNHTGENYTWVLQLKEGFITCIDFQLPEKTVQSNPWADMVVNTMAEGDYTRLNVSIIPRKPSVSVEPSIRGKIIDFSYPSEFEVAVFFPDYRIGFYGDWEDLNQGQSYNFSILVDELKEVELWLDKTHEGGSTEYSETLSLPVSELGSVTVAYAVPVKWWYESTQPQYTQSICIEFKDIKGFNTGT